MGGRPLCLKTPYLGSPSACLAILEELHLSQAVGPYQIALQTERAPYGITLQFQEACPQGALSSATEYLRFCGTVFQAWWAMGIAFRGSCPWKVGHPRPGHRGKNTMGHHLSHRLSAHLAAGPGGVAPGKPLSQTTQPE